MGARNKNISKIVSHCEIMVKEFSGAKTRIRSLLLAYKLPCKDVGLQQLREKSCFNKGITDILGKLYADLNFGSVFKGRHASMACNVANVVQGGGVAIPYKI